MSTNTRQSSYSPYLCMMGGNLTVVMMPYGLTKLAKSGYIAKRYSLVFVFQGSLCVCEVLWF